MAILQVVGFDPSLRHWGIAKGAYDTVAETLTISALTVSEPVIPKGKQIRQNSKDLEAAQQHTAAAVAASQGANAIFVEVPVGSQSARAMAGYALCVGVLGALRAGGINFYEVTPTEVKVIATRTKTASKAEMILWAVTTHPEAPWPYYKEKGQLIMSEAKAEHMADAIAAIYAGIASNPFKQTMALMKAN